MKTNFHAHTHHCGHATNQLEPLIELAIKQGFSHFGISEHMPLPNNHDRTITSYVLPKLIDEFVIAKAKYKDRINLYFGLECEYHEELEPLIKQYLKIPEIEYLIFGNHYIGSCDKHGVELWEVSKEELLADQYRNAKVAMESGYFSCYNHPDLFMRVYRLWDEHTAATALKFADLAIDNQIPLEFNLNGLYEKNRSNDPFMYPCEMFWREIAKTNAPVIIGVDTHSYKLMEDEIWQQALALIKAWGLEKNIISMIKFPKIKG